MPSSSGRKSSLRSWIRRIASILTQTADVKFRRNLLALVDHAGVLFICSGKIFGEPPLSLMWLYLPYFQITKLSGGYFFLQNRMFFITSWSYPARSIEEELNMHPCRDRSCRFFQLLTLSRTFHKKRHLLVSFRDKLPWKNLLSQFR